VLELVPGQSWGYVNRGKLRFETGDFAGAVLDLNYTIGRNPNDLPQAFLIRARAHAKLGNREQALADYAEYVKRVPGAADNAEIEAEIAALQD
jgi:predicted Zn-dependent protease